MKKLRFNFWVPLLFIFLTIIFFRSYFFSSKVPLPFNLLVSYYSPWKYTSWPGYPLGVPNKPLGFDNLKLFYPFRNFTTEEIKSGRLPLWNPYVFSGSVHHATYQSALFYPLNLVYLILPQIDAWSILVIIQPILTGWFTYLFLRSLRLSVASCLLGSLGFTFSGWMIAHWQEVLVIEHTILWLPLALYASNLIWESGSSKKGTVLLTLALTLAILAGFPQMMVYLVGTVVFWNLFRLRDKREPKSLLAVGLAIVLALIITAIQWLPALEAYLVSPRAQVDSTYMFQTFLTPLPYLITLIVPDFWGNPGSYNYFFSGQYLQERTIFIGVPIMLLALYGFFRPDRQLLFWKVFTIATLSLGLALPTSWVWYILRVPILSVAQPVRIFVLAVFGLSVMSAYGWEDWQKNLTYPKIRGQVFLMAAILTALWIYVLGASYFVRQQRLTAEVCVGQLASSPNCETFRYATISLRNLILPTVTLVLLWLSLKYVRHKTLLLTVLAGLTMLGSWHFASKLLYFSDRQFEYPLAEPITKLKELAGYNRVWSYGDGYMVRNILSYFRIYSPEGYEALYSHRYAILLQTIATRGVVTDQIHRTDATFSETGQYEAMANNPFRLRLMSLLGVKYILEHKDAQADTLLSSLERFPDSLFALAWENDQWRIWEYKEAAPRAWLVSQALVEIARQKIADILW